MGKLQEFAIFLDNPMLVYYAGQNVTGSLVVVANEPIKIRGVRVMLCGRADVHWRERVTRGSGDNRKTETVHYRAHQTYVESEMILFGTGPSGNAGDLHHPVGRHVYPFQFILPPNVPSSFEGSVGRIRYWLKGTIDKPWKFDHHCKRAFTVLSMVDLNVIPDVRSPAEARDSKTICCLCCKSGPISAVFRLDRHGYVPGEFIVMDGEVDNQSNRTLTSSKVLLMMVVKYHARGKTKTDNKTIAEMRRGSIEPGQSEVWTGVTLQIPALPPSGLELCSIITIAYYLQLVVIPSGPAINMTLPLGVVLGTVPLYNVYGYSAPPIAPPTAPPPDAAPPGFQPPSGDLPPPPTYTECVLGKVDLREEDDNEYLRGDLNWAPAYPCYNLPTPQGGLPVTNQPTSIQAGPQTIPAAPYGEQA